MKTRFLTVLSLAAALLLASCASPVERRIARNPEIFNSLSEGHKAKVAQGRVEEGMTKQAVFLAWGRPDRARRGMENGRRFDRWSYTGFDTIHGASYGVGMGFGGPWYHGHHYHYSYDPMYFYEPTVTYLPFEAGRVDFSNGKVSAWSLAR